MHAQPTVASLLLRGRVLLLVGGLVCGAWFTGAGGTPPVSVRQWQTEDGLPQNSVTCLIQSRTGYLWIGTYAGLVRFDGVRFKVFDAERYPGLVNGRITALFEDENSGLWIGHETGEVTRWEQGQMKPVTLPVAVGRSEILAIAAGGQGEIWAVNRDGWVVRLGDGHRIEPSKAPRRTSNSFGLVLESGGTLWCLRYGTLGVITNGQFVAWSAEPGADGAVQAIGAGRERGLWIAVQGQVRKRDAEQWIINPEAQPWRSDAIVCVAETSSGGVVVGTRENGLFIAPVQGEPRHFSRASGLSQDWVRCLLEDREGTIWVGLGNGGLNALTTVACERMDPPDRWQGRSVLPVAATRDGSVWVGTEGAGLYRWALGRWTQFGEPDGLENRYVWSLCELPDRRLFVGTWGGGLHWREKGRFEKVTGLESLTAPVTALLAGDQSELWIGTDAGIGRYAAGQIQWFRENAGVPLARVRCLARTPNGTIWFGMNGGGLGRLENGQLRQFRRADGLASDFVSCLYLDEVGALWIGTAGAGLIRFQENRFSRISAQQGLPSNHISHIERDDRGELWFGSSAGVLRARKGDLDQCADGKLPQVSFTVYGVGDGLETAQCSGGFQPAGARTADGCLWFPTRKGLVRIDPALLKTNSLPPPVVIERMLCAGAEVRRPNGNPEASVRIPPGRDQFEFEFTALSFAAPGKVRFKYRLDGLETEWRDRQDRRSAVYSYLRPGGYEFQVIACNNDGVWNQEGARFAFTVLPYFWQTWWFQALAGASGCAGVAAIVMLEARRRLRRKLDRIERQRALERERTRIAKDIHDDLGASLTRITMLSQSARQQLDQPAEVSDHLDRIHGTARELTRAMDEIVWAVNPRHDTLDSLAIYIVRFAQDFLSPAGIRCRVDMPMNLPSWPLGAELRHNVFLAFKEAIHNVVKHGAAQEVQVALHPGESSFELRVQDDGKGFDPTGNHVPRPGGGNGLRNMRLRMEEIGGAVVISSQPGSGTKVVFSVPMTRRADRPENSKHRQN